MDASDSYRLEMEGIWKSFGGVPVLSQVDLQLKSGEVLALLGSNGAGKSTLMKILCGAYSRDRGSVRLDREEVAFTTPQDAIARGVRLLPQEISVMPDLSVAENIFIGDLPLRRRFGVAVVDREKMQDGARHILDQLGVGIDPGWSMQQLSLPEQRVVEIARALVGKVRVLVMDEPTAALTDREAHLLFDIIDRLKHQRVSVIYISHYLDEVFQVSDRIVVLRDGRNAGTFMTATTSRQEVLVAMLGSALEELYPESSGHSEKVVMQVDGLAIPGELEPIHFDVRRGEIIGLFGLLGSGSNGVGRAIYGMRNPLPGARITVDGRPFRPSTARAARKAGIGLVAAERQREGIIPDLSVRENMTMPFVERFRRGLALSVARESAYVQHWIDQLGIQSRGSEQLIRFLSGGNQQKVCLARWLVEGIRVLILEEPTRGVDIGARKGIYAELRRLTAQGLAIIIASSDAEEVAGMCDRVIVLDRGVVVGRFTHGVLPAELMDAATQAVPSEGRIPGTEKNEFHE